MHHLNPIRCNLDLKHKVQVALANVPENKTHRTKRIQKNVSDTHLERFGLDSVAIRQREEKCVAVCHSVLCRVPGTMKRAERSGGQSETLLRIPTKKKKSGCLTQKIPQPDISVKEPHRPTCAAAASERRT